MRAKPSLSTSVNLSTIPSANAVPAPPCPGRYRPAQSPDSAIASPGYGKERCFLVLCSLTVCRKIVRKCLWGGAFNIEI